MILDKFKLADQVAVVTGAGRGVGKGIAVAFAEAGANVVCTARTLKEIESTAAEVRALGRRAMAIPTDVRDAEQVDNMVKKTVEEFGQLDILVNNAGGSSLGQLIGMSQKNFEGALRENLTACFLCCKAAANVMIKQKKGNIINISSRAAQQGTMNVGHYAAAKAGMNNLTETLAWELACYNIRVNCLCLGPIDTETLHDYWGADEGRRLGQLLINRPGLPKEDVGAFCVFLASDASSWITGQVYRLDGGLRFTPSM